LLKGRNKLERRKEVGERRKYPQSQCLAWVAGLHHFDLAFSRKGWSERWRSASQFWVTVSPVPSPFGGGSKLKPRGLSREAGRVRRDGEGGNTMAL